MTLDIIVADTIELQHDTIGLNKAKVQQQSYKAAARYREGGGSD